MKPGTEARNNKYMKYIYDAHINIKFTNEDLDLLCRAPCIRSLLDYIYVRLRQSGLIFQFPKLRRFFAAYVYFCDVDAMFCKSIPVACVHSFLDKIATALPCRLISLATTDCKVLGVTLRSMSGAIIVCGSKLTQSCFQTNLIFIHCRQQHRTT